jgi:bifunctional non-homologous end joining protein LigD
VSDLLQGMPEEEFKKAKERNMPGWMGPMLAKLTHDYFSDEDWIFERKLDGERVISYVKADGQVDLMSRNKKQVNDAYPEIEASLAKLAVAGCILDGEVVAFNENNVSDFQKLQPRMQSSNREEAKKSDVKVYYYIFDCLYIDGYDITGCGLYARKGLLKKAVDWNDPLRYTTHRKKDGLEFYKEACEKGWEGLIAKDAHSSYFHSRSSHWLKFKCSRQQEFVIAGFTEPHGERIGFGALLVGFYRDGDLVYAGKVGTGFDDKTLKELREKLDDIERDQSPFDQGEPETQETHFVSPELVCQVSFTEWTNNDRLRHPSYKGLRRDGDPTSVHKEVESQSADL